MLGIIIRAAFLPVWGLLSEIVRDMQALFRQSGDEYLTIRSASIDHRVKKDSIVMIEKYGGKAYVYTTGARLTCNITLEKFQTPLCDLPSVTQRDPPGMKLTLEGGLEAFVSRNYRKRVFP